MYRLLAVFGLFQRLRFNRFILYRSSLCGLESVWSEMRPRLQNITKLYTWVRAHHFLRAYVLETFKLT